MDRVVSDLIEARRLIAEVGWVQGGLSRNLKGELISPWDPAARCFCIAGAIMRAVDMTNYEVNNRYLDCISKMHAVLKLPIPKWNDRADRTREEVVKAFDQVIEYVKSKK